VLAYLVGCLLNPATAGKSFDIGGAEIFTYLEMMQKYAEVRVWQTHHYPSAGAHPAPVRLLGRPRYPYLSGIAHPLIEGLKNEVVCKNNEIDNYVPSRRHPSPTLS